MALDGMMLSLIKDELKEELIDAHISQIHQPSKDELVINFRTKNGAKKLLLSCRVDCARVHLLKTLPKIRLLRRCFVCCLESVCVVADFLIFVRLSLNEFCSSILRLQTK